MNNYEKCGYYSDDEYNICGMGMSGEDTFCRLCKDNPNCYYKQLLELKAKNERLKEENEKLNKMTGIFSARLCKKYRQTLQEIKTIAENYIKGCVDCSLIAEPYECEDCTDGGMAKLGKKILELIKEDNQ